MEIQISCGRLRVSFLFFGVHTLLTSLVSLSPMAHGRSIMTAVLGTLTGKWLIPYMNVHHMIGAYLDHNIVSKRVFEHDWGEGKENWAVGDEI